MPQTLSHDHWPHSPIHKINTTGTYMVTASTYQKQHFFRKPEMLDMMQTALLSLSNKYAWSMQAWAIFSNHYHFVAQSSANPQNLRDFLRHLHGAMAHTINLRDKQPGRMVWYQYWETKLTYQNSYLARLHYVHQNPVKHGLVTTASDYPWCSARWFELSSNKVFKQSVYRFKIDNLNVIDGF